MRKEQVRSGFAFLGVLVIGILLGVLLCYFIMRESGTDPTKQIAAKSISVDVAKALEAEKAPAKPATTVPCPPSEKKYEVRKNDNLWKIAEAEYNGRGYLWRILAEANDIGNPDLIQVGQILVVPCRICELPALKEKPAKKPTTKKVAAAPKSTRKAVTVQASKPEPQPAPSVKTEPAVTVVQPTPPPAPPQVAPEPKKVEQPAPAPAVVVVQQQMVNVAAQPVSKPVVVEKPKPAPPTEVAVEKFTTIKKLPPSSPRLIVGSAWNSLLQTPLERENYVDYFHADVGVVVATLPGKIQVEPYVGVNSTKDTKGFSWNNKIQGEAGVKLVRPFKNGIVQVGGAYAAEKRFFADGPSQTRTGFIGFTDGWFGWKQPTSQPSEKKFLPGSLPGTFQWRAGNISPFERNNFIGVARADQGITLVKLGRVSFIPTAFMQVGADTDGNPWNNRYMYGGGLKIAIPWRSGVLDLQGGYQCAKQYAGTSMAGVDEKNCGPGFSVNIWTGLRKVIGRR